MTTGKDKAALKPCPFCKPVDSDPTVRTGSDFTKANYSVYCRCCHVSTPIFANENMARERWNTRATLAPAVVEPVASGKTANTERKNASDYWAKHNAPEPEKAQGDDKPSVEAMYYAIDRVWRWIERAKWDKSLGMQNCIDTLIHNPMAPWNADRDAWNTRHKEYDQQIDDDIQAYIELKERREPPADLSLVRTALEIAVGYVAFVAADSPAKPATVARAKDDCRILSEALAELDKQGRISGVSKEGE